MTKETVIAAIARAPAIKPVLVRLAKRAAAGKKLPETFSATGLDYAAQRELEGIVLLPGVRQPDDRVYFALVKPMNDPALWRGLLPVLGIEEKKSRDDNEDVFERLKLLEPFVAPLVDKMAANEEIKRYLARCEDRSDWITLFRKFSKSVETREYGRSRTLSQLGSDWFNDSKKLRSGPLRRQLAVIISAMFGGDPDDERKLFENFGIVDNPYTSIVSVSLPIVLKVGDETFDFPCRFHEMGLACQLTTELLRRVTEISWCSKDKVIVTSENAAPFAEFAKAGIPCIYTEGYPNYAVKMCLSMLRRHEALKWVHEGDADLDGFCIAAEVARFVNVSRASASKALYLAQRNGCQFGKPLSDEQRARIKAFLSDSKNERFPYLNEIRQILDLGIWIEQESFNTILDGWKGRWK